MIQEVESGKFDTFILANGTDVLQLDDKTYRWANPNKIGVLELIGIKNRASTPMSTRTYRLVDVSSEQYYRGVLHLELMYAPHEAQGYLLPSGLPKHLGDIKPIIPTNELIVDSFSIKNLVAKLRILDGRGIKPVTGAV